MEIIFSLLGLFFGGLLAFMPSRVSRLLPLNVMIAGLMVGFFLIIEIMSCEVLPLIIISSLLFIYLGRSAYLLADR